MKIYVAHARDFDYKKELYGPIRKSILNRKYEFILPHEESEAAFNSRDLLKEGGNVMIADISTPSTGRGIEIGWANAWGNKIICIYKKGSTLSKSIHMVTKEFIEYETPADLIKKIEKTLENKQ